MTDPVLRTYHETSERVETSTSAIKKLGEFAYREWNKPTEGIPLKRRLALIRRGYHSTRAEDYNLDRYELADYLPDYSGAISPGSIAGQERVLAENKHTFYRLLSIDHPEVVPTIHGIVDRGQVFDERGERIANDIDGWIRERLDSSDRLVCKPVSGVGGADVYILERADDGVVVNGKYSRIETFTAAIDYETAYLVTDFAQQAAYADEIFPDATNTLRILTLWNYDIDEPFIAAAAHRFGVEKSAPVDNWSKGGLSVDIDLDRGILKNAAHNASDGVRWVDEHPDTGVPITGTELPHWEHTHETLLSMAAQLRQLPLIGWDIVITDTGPTVLEGNTTPGHQSLQVHEPFLVDSRRRRFFSHHDVV